MACSRRSFTKLALCSLPAAAAVPANPERMFAAEKPKSKFNGVQIGLITAYSYHNMANDVESIVKYMVRDGNSATEMEVPMQEAFAGAPKGWPRPAFSPPPPGSAPRQRPPMTPEQIAAQKAHAEELTKWRRTVSMDRQVALRKKFNDAGIWICGFKPTSR